MTGTRRAKTLVIQLPPRLLFSARIVAVCTDKKKINKTPFSELIYLSQKMGTDNYLLLLTLVPYQ
jgi:hypothetical protein